MKKEVWENHEKYLERVNLYQSFGYDIEKERRLIIEKAKPLDGQILEIGTGKGYFSIELARQGYHFTSVDISKAEQDIARLNIEYFGLEELVNLQIEKENALSFKDRSFDVVFCINALHHFIYPFQMVDEMMRVSSSHGKIILSDFTQEGFAVIEKILATEGREHEVSTTTLEDMENYFISKDFAIIKYQSALQKMLIAYFYQNHR